MAVRQPVVLQAWADAHLAFALIDAGGGYRAPTAGVLSSLIDWKSNAPKFGGQITGEVPMQRQFTIEVRVDYADNGKNDAMRVAIKHAARHIYGTALLLSDGVKPDIAAFSDDFFSGHQEIDHMEDIIGKGLTEISEQSEAISSDLADAFK